ncbi:MAG: ABC transporter permease, partial [Dehalococcoidia bacterium]
ALEGPSWDHLFGTDRDGRDLFSRALFSARTTMVFSILAFLFGNVFLGLGLGLLAGYKGGWVDAVIMRIGDVTMAIPGLLVLIVISSALRADWTEGVAAIDEFFGMTFLIDQGVDHISLLFFALSMTGWVLTARFVRAQTLALRETDFVMAAEAIGAGTPRILVRHLFPGILPWIIVGMSASLGAAAGAEVGLTFLGLGIQPPTPSFGAMIAAAGGVRTFELHPHLLIVPGLTVAILIYSFNLLGDAVNDVVSPRGR